MITTPDRGPRWIGRITVRSSNTPPPNDNAIVAPNAGQNDHPWSTSVQQMNVDSVAELALREIEHARRAVDHHDRERKRAVDAARREAARHVLQEAGHQ